MSQNNKQSLCPYSQAPCRSTGNTSVGTWPCFHCVAVCGVFLPGTTCPRPNGKPKRTLQVDAGRGPVRLTPTSRHGVPFPRVFGARGPGSQRLLATSCVAQDGLLVGKGFNINEALPSIRTRPPNFKPFNGNTTSRTFKPHDRIRDEANELDQNIQRQGWKDHVLGTRRTQKQMQVLTNQQNQGESRPRRRQCCQTERSLGLRGPCRKTRRLRKNRSWCWF